MTEKDSPTKPEPAVGQAQVADSKILHEPAFASDTGSAGMANRQVADGMTTSLGETSTRGVEAPIEAGTARPAMTVTQMDVIAAYKMFLGRQPESLEVVLSRVGFTPEQVLLGFLTCDEFLKHPENANIVLSAAQRISSLRFSQ